MFILILHSFLDRYNRTYICSLLLGTHFHVRQQVNMNIYVLEYLKKKSRLDFWFLFQQHNKRTFQVFWGSNHISAVRGRPSTPSLCNGLVNLQQFSLIFVHFPPHFETILTARGRVWKQGRLLSAGTSKSVAFWWSEWALKLFDRPALTSEGCDGVEMTPLKLSEVIASLG